MKRNENDGEYQTKTKTMVNTKRKRKQQRKQKIVNVVTLFAIFLCCYTIVKPMEDFKKDLRNNGSNEVGFSIKGHDDHNVENVGFGTKDRDDHNDDKFCVIHVGPHKTGTTSLQRFLLGSNKDDLATDGYATMIGNGRKGVKTHADFANCAMTPFTPKEQCESKALQERILTGFQSFVDDAAANRSNIFLSTEAFDKHHFDITELTSVLVPKHYKIHIVVYYRRFYDWIHSMYNQKTKVRSSNIHTTFVQWMTNDMLESFLLQYSLDVYNRFTEASGIFNVSVVNMHEDPHNFNTNIRFTCDHMDNAPHLCAIAKSKPVKHSNTSRDLTWKVFRKSTHFYHSIRLSDSDEEKWMQIRAKFDEMTDIPQLCLSPEMKEKVLQISLEAEKALTPESWYNGEEGLENLKSDFEAKIISKLCSMDIEKILMSPEWQHFLTDLEEDKLRKDLEEDEIEEGS